MIPEFVGRVPIIAPLHDLDKEALKEILTEPKNALVKQFQKLFEIEGIKLTFAPEALDTIADESIERKIGARGLRMILEELMLDIMYEIPSQKNVKEVVIIKDTVLKKSPPIVVMENANIGQN